MSFESLGLPKIFCEALAQQKILTPTPVQLEAYPLVQSGKNILALSKTGSGKTFAYLLPLLAQESTPPKTHLILVPTRELANQVAQVLQTLKPEAKFAVVIGGEAEEKQIAHAKDCQWIIGTPGRILDLGRRRLLPLPRTEVLVFDEADRLLDMGFEDDIRTLRQMLPQKIQFLLFSATHDLSIESFLYSLGATNLERIQVSRDELQIPVGLKQEVAIVGDEEKFHALVHYLFNHLDAKGIIFSNFKEKAHTVSSRLKGLGFNAEALTSSLSQAKRTQIVERMRSQNLQILLASDLAARGLDIQDLDFVINFDLPEESAQYVHRVGRTARAGKSGYALSFVGFEDSFRLEKLEKFLNHKLERLKLDPTTLSGELPRRGKAIHSPSAPTHTTSTPHKKQHHSNKTPGKSHHSSTSHSPNYKGSRPYPKGNSQKRREPYKRAYIPAAKKLNFWGKLKNYFRHLWK